MSPREPLGAAKSQKTAFTKRWFSRWTVDIFSLLKRPKSASRSPRDSQETPKELQNAMQKSTKKNHKKVLSGKKCLKPAISKRPPLRPLFSPPSLHIFVNMFYTCFFTTFSKKVETHFGTHFGIRVAQEGQDEPKRAIRSFKEPKTFIFKNLKKTLGFLKVFGYRGFSRKPQEAQDGSQKTPNKSKTPKNRNPKLRPKIIKKIGTNF